MNNPQAYNSSPAVTLPSWILILHAAQALLAVIIVGLVGYSYHFYNNLDTSFFGIKFLIVDSWNLNLFTCVFTWIILLYILLSRHVIHNFHSKRITLGLQVLAVIFWLSSFASLAAYISGTDFFKCTEDEFGNISCNETPRNTSAAAAGLGAIEFVLFLLTAVVTGRYTWGHITGSMSTPAQAHQTPAQYNQGAPVYNEQAPQGQYNKGTQEQYNQGAPAQYSQGAPVQYSQGTNDQYNQGNPVQSTNGGAPTAYNHEMQSGLGQDQMGPGYPQGASHEMSSPT